MTTQQIENPAEIGPDGWDKEAIYDAEISPLMSQIIAICNREGIPMFASFAFRKSDDTGDGRTFFCTTHLPGPRGEFIEELNRCAESVRRTFNSLTGFRITTIQKEAQ